MYARVTTAEISLGKLRAAEDDAAQRGANPITKEPGFQETMTLMDRQTGKGMTVGLWDTLEHLEASAPVHQAGLDRLAQAGMLESAPRIEVFEVLQKTDPQ